MFGYIYMTINKINGNRYIGKKKGSFDENYYGSGIILLNALRKYGKENFEVKILEYCDNQQLLNEKEIYYISNNNPEYNIAKGGDGGDTLQNSPKEYKKQIIKKRNNGLKKTWGLISEEKRKAWGKAISKAKKGKPINNKNRVYTDEQKKKISESNKLWWMINSPEKIKERREKQLKSAEKRKGIPNKKCWKKVEVDGIIYNSMKEACNSLDVSFPTLKKKIMKGDAKYV